MCYRCPGEVVVACTDWDIQPCSVVLDVSGTQPQLIVKYYGDSPSDNTTNGASTVDETQVKYKSMIQDNTVQDTPTQDTPTQDTGTVLHIESGGPNSDGRGLQFRISTYPSDSGCRTFKCGECNVVHRKCGMMSHLLCHARAVSPSRYHCWWCEWECKSRNDFKAHILKEHEYNSTFEYVSQSAKDHGVNMRKAMADDIQPRKQQTEICVHIKRPDDVNNSAQNVSDCREKRKRKREQDLVTDSKNKSANKRKKSNKRVNNHAKHAASTNTTSTTGDGKKCDLVHVTSDNNRLETDNLTEPFGASILRENVFSTPDKLQDMANGCGETEGCVDMCGYDSDMLSDFQADGGGRPAWMADLNRDITGLELLEKTHPVGELITHNSQVSSIVVEKACRSGVKERKLGPRVKTPINSSSCVRCSVCGKTFLNEHLLKRHSFVHGPGGTKTHVCELCGLSFPQQLSVWLHLKTVHKVNMPQK